MDAVRLARKLEPLMRDRVARWLRARETARAELRSLIDAQIHRTAHAVLGDAERRILLSLPPKEKARGQIELGTVLYERPKWPFGLSPAELLQNLAVFGRSGAGKTNVTFHLLRQLERRSVPFLFLDWKRTGRHLLPHLRAAVNVYTPGRELAPLAFNPFVVPPGLEPRVYVNHVVDVLADAYTLGEGSRSIVQRALWQCYETGNEAPSAADVLAAAEAVPGQERVRGWKLSARRALESLAFSAGASGARLGQEALARRLLSQSTVLELDALPAAAKKFLIPLLCLWLFFAKLAGSRREQLDLVIVVEEAHHVLYRQEHKAKESLMNMLLRQCRELGIGMVVVDQHPHLISSAALGNTHTSICLNLKDPSDINKAAGLSLIPEAEKACFSLLPVGQGVVKLQSRWHRPFLVQFPLVPLHKGVMTDQRLRQRLAGLATRSDPKWPQGGSVDRVRHVRPDDTPLDSGAAALLGDVARYRDDGVRARYARLGMSAGRGNRLKDALVRGGWLEEEVVPRGRTRTVLLRLTAAGRALLPHDEAEPDATPRESIGHEYWKRHYERVLSQGGYAVQVEAPRHGGRADLLATRHGERLAVEVETGKSDVVSNVKNSLRSGCERVIVAATSAEAQDVVERQLGTAGLIIRGRVDIVLCGELPQWLDEAGHEA